MEIDVFAIPGCMFGIEFPPNDEGVWFVLDLFIVRFIVGSFVDGEK